ncbi:MAG: hypothetical protein GY928_04875 [Colwellia sp.]|nr:hypothetical protein [Colwellia sp.]
MELNRSDFLSNEIEASEVSGDDLYIKSEIVKDYIDSIESELANINSLLDIRRLGDLTQIEDAHTQLTELLKDIY